MKDIVQTTLNRRAFLKNGSLVLAAGCLQAARPAAASAEETTADVLRVGLITDLHYADKPPAGSRHYRETLDKLAEAAQRLAQAKPAFVAELGDFIDAADSVQLEQRYLRRINREFQAISADRHYVLGNHCVDTLTKAEFLAGIEQEHAYYAFDRGGFRFVVLDSCFRSDGEPYGRKNFQWTDPNIPPAELEWLAADLKSTGRNVIVFAHQRLDVSNKHAVRNATDVRRALEDSGRVLAVFQGHSHQNDYREINRIHYCTLAAMVEGSGAESNGYSLLEIHPDATITVHGFRRQASYRWEAER